MIAVSMPVTWVISSDGSNHCPSKMSSTTVLAESDSQKHPGRHGPKFDIWTQKRLQPGRVRCARPRQLPPEVARHTSPFRVPDMFQASFNLDEEQVGRRAGWTEEQVGRRAGPDCAMS